MVQHRFTEFLPAFTDVLGVECVDDLTLVTEADLSELGMKPIQARRFARLVASPATALHLQRTPEPHNGLDDNLSAVSTPGGASVVHISGDGGSDAADQGAPRHPGVAPLTRHGKGRKAPSLQRDGSGSDDDPEWSNDGDVEPEAPQSKRRKTTRLSLAQRVSASAAELRGSGRLRLPITYDNGTARSSSMKAAAAG